MDKEIHTPCKSSSGTFVFLFSCFVQITIVIHTEVAILQISQESILDVQVFPRLSEVPAPCCLSSS